MRTSGFTGGSHPPRILIADDDQAVLRPMVDLFEWEGFQVAAATEVEQILPQLDSFQPDVLLLDLFYGTEASGQSVLTQIRSTRSKEDLPILVITGYATSGLMLDALNNGANDFIRKPISRKELLDKIHRLLKPAWSGREEAEVWSEKLVGSSDAILDLTMKVWKTAELDMDTMILGETGTGKDLVARLIHRLGPRREKAFYAIDCTTIAPHLFESEVFGHEKHAFTGARYARKGKIEEAEGGLVFFNEIGDLPLEQQAKLLTFLETKTFTRLGSNKPMCLDVTILAATNRSLEKMVRLGAFRQDLFYRLAGNVLHLPPLREHTEDIPSLVAYFIEKYNDRYKKCVRRADDAVVKKFQAMPWSGNVRELEKCVMSAVQVCQDEIIMEKDIRWPLEAGRSNLGKGWEEQLRSQDYRAAKQAMVQNFHQDYLVHHLSKNHWNVSKTAQSIGIPREQMSYLMKRYGVAAKISTNNDKNQ